MTIADMFKNVTYSQSGANGATITATGGFFNAGVIEANPGDFTSATVTLPDGTTVQDLPMTDPKTFGNGVSFATKAAMDAAYPMGDYVLTGHASGGGSQSETLHYTKDGYANMGQLDAASYNGLQGISTTASPFTVGFNTQVPAAGASFAFTFFTIFGSDQFCSFLAASATGCTIDPSHLTPGTTYTYELDFSDCYETNSADGVLLGVDFDVRTDGTFTTAALAPAAVPEPADWTLMAIGFVGLGTMARRRRGVQLAV